MKYGFLDESGDVGHATGSSHNLIIVVVVADNPARLRKVVAKTRKRLGKRRKDIPEFKAFKTDVRITNRLLRHAAKTECEIVALVADKKVMGDLDDPEALYRQLCALAVRRCLERHPQLSLCVDKRYTNPHLREKQNRVILKEISSVQQAVLVVEYSESKSESALQVADAVAWALFQKYERGDDSFYTLVKDKIIIEELWESK
ncbi:MAG: DUF3800 domain-containing protein [Anaerolineae bacterium]